MECLEGSRGTFRPIGEENCSVSVQISPRPIAEIVGAPKVRPMEDMYEIADQEDLEPAIYSNIIPEKFLEGSRGTYWPIRVLFHTPIYERAMQLCWTMGSYKCQVALVMELLRLQQNNLIPSQVTAEDMIDLLLEEYKSSVRELLWDFELEGFDMEVATPLLKLVWAVNVRNKSRDVECEARMLLNSQGKVPDDFQHIKVRSMAQNYAKVLQAHEEPGPKVLSPSEVALEVVPKVLHGFWVLPCPALLNMPSKSLSTLSVGVTRAVMDQVSRALTTEHKATFSRSKRDETVHFVLTKIRKSWPHDLLVDSINQFQPALLSEIVNITTEQICGFFKSQSPEESVDLVPTVEPPVIPPVQEEVNLVEMDEQPTHRSEGISAEQQTLPASPAPPAEPLDIIENSKQIKDPELATEENCLVSVQISPRPIAELVAAPNVQAMEDTYEIADQEDLEPAIYNNMFQTQSPEVSANLVQTVEPSVIPLVHKDVDLFVKEKQSMSTLGPDAAVPPHASPPVQEEVNLVEMDEQPTHVSEGISAEQQTLPASPAPPAEPLDIIENSKQIKDPELAIEENCSVSVQISPRPIAEIVGARNFRAMEDMYEIADEEDLEPAIYSNIIPEEFLEGSRGTYWPIRVLFHTPIYERAMQLCWTMGSYKCQVALVMELLRLQQNNLIPSQVTAEDMIDLLLEEYKSSVRELLWDFELEGFDMEVATPLLKLVWAVNVRNKSRDVECEARMLLNSQGKVPDDFQHIKVRTMVQNYAKVLQAYEEPGPKVLSPSEVVLEVVPKVLHGFWVFPGPALLNMPSKSLSTLSVGVTRAVMDQVSRALTTEHKATFSRSKRDETVHFVLTKIRKSWPHDLLVDSISQFQPALLSEIVNITTEQICGFFKSQSHEESANLVPTVEPPVIPPVQEEVNLVEMDEQPTHRSEGISAEQQTLPASPAPPAEPLDIIENSKQIKDPELATEENCSVSVQISPIPIAELVAAPNVQAMEDTYEIADQEDLEPAIYQTRSPEVSANLVQIVEPSVIPLVHEDVDLFVKEKQSMSTLGPDAAVPPLASPQVQEEVNLVEMDEQPTHSSEGISAELQTLPASTAPPAEPLDIIESSEPLKDPELTKVVNCSVQISPRPLAEPACAIEVQAMVNPMVHSESKRGKKKMNCKRFFRWLFKPLSCCVRTHVKDID